MFLRIVILGCVALASTPSIAQWWPLFAPRDYEDCAASAEKTATTKEARASLLAECDAKFSGRRKPGGGYTYYDFMQNRHFDIAGPNPTPEELKRMDDEYIVYLDRQRRNAIAAALAEKQRQQALAELERSAAMRAAAAAPLALTSANTAPANALPAINHRAARSKAARCQHRTLSCAWSALSSSVKSLFGPSAKTRHHAKT
jgi:ribosomal protein L12E/L44/L45/RPP1/RPP2